MVKKEIEVFHETTLIASPFKKIGSHKMWRSPSLMNVLVPRYQNCRPLQRVRLHSWQVFFSTFWLFVERSRNSQRFFATFLYSRVYWTTGNLLVARHTTCLWEENYYRYTKNWYLGNNYFLLPFILKFIPSPQSHIGCLPTKNIVFDVITKMMILMTMITTMSWW